jgi:hypothetical protein
MERSKNRADGVGVMHTGFLKAIAQPVADLTRLTVRVMYCLSSAIAQVSALQELAPAPVTNSPKQQPATDILEGGDCLVGDSSQGLQERSEYRRQLQGFLYVVLIRGISIWNITMEQLTDAISSAYTRFLKRLIVAVTLNQGLLTVGEFKGSRRLGSSRGLSHLKPDGMVLRQDVPSNFKRGVDEQNNPILRENDIIVVRRSNATRLTDASRLLLNSVASVLTVLSILGNRLTKRPGTLSGVK